MKKVDQALEGLEYRKFTIKVHGGKVIFVGRHDRKRVELIVPKRKHFYQEDKSKDEIEEYWKKQYIRIAEWPMSWNEKANSLKLASDLLYAEYKKEIKPYNEGKEPSDYMFIVNGLITVYMMLTGYAFECLLKGIYSNYGSIIDDSGNLNKWWKAHGHCLSAIVEKINDLAKHEIIKLSEKEYFLLKRLYEFIVWAGRYPIPTDYKDKMPVELQNGSGAPLYFTTNKDKQRIDELFDRLATILETFI